MVSFEYVIVALVSSPQWLVRPVLVLVVLSKAPFWRDRRDPTSLGPDPGMYLQRRHWNVAINHFF